MRSKLSMKMIVVVLVAATALPIPAMADDLRCTALYNWDFDGNGFGGTLNISVGGGGNLTGTVYGDPIQGFYNNVSNEMMFIRSAGGSTDPGSQQVFTGYYWQEGLLDVNKESNRLTLLADANLANLVPLAKD